MAAERCAILRGRWPTTFARSIPLPWAPDDPNNFSELLQELRVLLQGSQLLAGFLGG